MYCSSCGKEISDDSVFCCYCGKKQDKDFYNENCSINTAERTSFERKSLNAEVTNDDIVKNAVVVKKTAVNVSDVTRQSQNSAQSKTSVYNPQNNKQSISQSSAATIGGNSAESEKKSHGCLIAFVVLLIIGLMLFGVIKYVFNEKAGNSDGNLKLLSRSAYNSDITIDSQLDISSLGQKIVLTPQTDIKDLEVKVVIYDKNNSQLYSTVKQLGNVTEGVQVSFTISITDLGLSTSIKGDKMSVSVVGGTVSYFA